MKQILFLCLILLPVLHVSGQRQNVDSLINVLETQKLTTKDILQLYDKISSYYSDKDAEKSLQYANQGLYLAEKENDKEIIASIYSTIGTAFFFKSSLDSSLIFLNRSIALAQEIKENEVEARAISNRGNLYILLSENEKALADYLKSMTLYESMNDKVSSTRLLLNLSSLYNNIGQSEKSLHYLNQAQANLEIIDQPHMKTAVYQLTGGVYLKMKDYEKALESMLIAFDLSRKNELIRYEVITTQYIAGIYSDGFQDYENAEKYAAECVKIAESADSKDLLITAWNILAKVYIDANKFKEGKDIALKVWNADSTRVISAINTAYHLAVSYLHLGEKENALYFFEKRNDLKNEVTKKEFLNSISDIEIRYETEKKEIRIASLEKERELYIWLGIAGILLMVALIIVLWQTIRNARKEKQLIATRSVLDGEMKERTRLAQDLHDRLSGNLSAVKIELGSQEEALQNIREKLDNCIRDIREAAHNIMPSSLQFGMKVALEDFATQFPDVRFHFFGKEKRVDERIEYVVYCCANELINNSIRHSGAKNINLQLIQDEKYITLTVSDDGCGFDEKNVTKGFGLKSIRDRVASCNGKTDISTSPGKGTETTIELRIEKSY